MTESSSIENLFPFQSHFLNVDGQRLHYVDEGRDPAQTDQPTLVMLHGNPTWCFYYRNLIARFRSTFRVVAMDYLGCGLSDHPEDKHYRFIDRVNQVDALLSHLKIGNFSLVLHDWGGPIGSAVALRHLDSVEKIVYLNTTLTETESLPGIIRRAAHPLIGPFLTKFSASFLRLTTEVGVATRLPADVKSAYFYPYRTIGKRTAIWDFVADIPFESRHPSYPEMLDLATKLPLLRQKPVQIIWGLKDPCFHREMLTQVSRHFPQAKVLEIAEASHLVLEDAPELAFSTIEKFLNEPSIETQQYSATSSTSIDKGLSSDVSEPHSLEADRSNALFRAYNRFAENHATEDAVIVPNFEGARCSYAHTTYRVLSDLINKYQRGLSELGLRAGDRVLMLVPPGQDFISLAYAVMGRGAIPVFVDPGIGLENLIKCIADADPQGFIGAPKAHMLRFLKRRIFQKLKFSVVTSNWSIGGGASLGFLRKFSSAPLPPVENDGTTLIAFTSGATGVPKGVMYTNRMVETQLDILANVFGLSVGKKDLPLLPIFSLFNLALGVASVYAPVDPKAPLSLEPQKIVQIIRDLSINTSFGSPTLWNKVAEYCVRTGTTLDTIEKIFMAGAAVPPDVLARVQSILPQGKACTPYGATEALPVTFIRSEEIQQRGAISASSGEEGTIVGQPVRGVEIKIIDLVSGPIKAIQDVQELATGEIGEIIVRGHNISPQYLKRPEADAKAKIPDSSGLLEGKAGFWHRLGDVGYQDADNNLYYCGRSAHIVEVAGRRFHSVPLEAIFNRHPAVHRSALVRLNTTGKPAIVIEPKPSNWPESEETVEKFIAELRQIAHSNSLCREIEHFFFHKSFPVDARHNAKIFRDKLGDYASECYQKMQAQNSKLAANS